MCIWWLEWPHQWTESSLTEISTMYSTYYFKSWWTNSWSSTNSIKGLSISNIMVPWISSSIVPRPFSKDLNNAKNTSCIVRVRFVYLWDWSRIGSSSFFWRGNSTWHWGSRVVSSCTGTTSKASISTLTRFQSVWFNFFTNHQIQSIRPAWQFHCTSRTRSRVVSNVNDEKLLKVLREYS